MQFRLTLLIFVVLIIKPVTPDEIVNRCACSNLFFISFFSPSVLLQTPNGCK